MHHRNRRQAIAGVTIWGGVFLAFAALLIGGRVFPDWFHRLNAVAVPAFVLTGMAVQYASFLWGGHHLTKGKGHPGTLVQIGAILFPLQPFLWIAMFALPDRFPRPVSNPRPADRRPHESMVARTVRYRRNALIGNVLGLLGITFALSLLVFPMGFSPDDENVLILVVFLLGYAALISGCGWWLKAKAWPDGLVFIGLMPLAVLLIPGLRMIYFVEPDIFIVSMIMMPIILLVITWLLPDKSGVTRRRD